MNKINVADVNASPYMAYIAVTGGGVSFINNFLSFGGGSKTILGFEVPYKEEFLQEFIGQKPEKYVSPDTARKMAMAAYRKACKVQDPLYAIGIGCTASLTTPQEREGRKHRVSIALQSATTCRTVNLVFSQFRPETGDPMASEYWTRESQELWVSDLIFTVLAEKTLGRKFEEFDECVCYNLIGEMQRSLIDLSDNQEWVDFFTGKTDIYVNGPKTHELLQKNHAVIFSGSFNPVHAGHIEMYEKAKEITGITPIFEVSIENVDKPELNLWDMRIRHDQFVDFPFILTRAPFFTDKAYTVRDAYAPTETNNGFDKRIDFIMGLDTWERFSQNVHKENNVLRFHKAFQENVGFVVFNRGGKQIDEFKYNFKHVTFVHGFNNPISSTQLRQAKDEK